mmetsp:Transcript_62544/g.117001  ORF Transcript_62544/g.117001 Transcript_62544/m.117001 type:complete len:256 (-) Transcript_62544:71-838(-)
MLVSKLATRTLTETLTPAVHQVLAQPGDVCRAVLQPKRSRQLPANPGRTKLCTANRLWAQSLEHFQRGPSLILKVPLAAEDRQTGDIGAKLCQLALLCRPGALAGLLPHLLMALRRLPALCQKPAALGAALLHSLTNLEFLQDLGEALAVGVRTSQDGGLDARSLAVLVGFRLLEVFLTRMMVELELARALLAAPLPVGEAEALSILVGRAVAAAFRLGRSLRFGLQIKMVVFASCAQHPGPQLILARNAKALRQ